MNGSDYYRKRAVKRLGIVVVVLIVIGVGVWYFTRSNSFQRIAALETSAEKIAAQGISSNFSAPPPLIATSTPGENQIAASGTVAGNGFPVNQYTLTVKGVVADTNVARATNGKLPPLAENATLDEIAQIRLADMFAKQYFAHISPSSSSAVTVASSVGYEYIALGENLALGNFTGDQGVLTAWMNSPGHRANILDVHYTQIGVAVGEGEFQGNLVWIAVQVFGRPLSDCPAPSANLKLEINSAEDQISAMQSQLQAEQAQIDATESQSQSSDTYDQEVNNYDALVAQYNNLVAQAKGEVAQYNAEVNTYNQCISS